MGLVVKKIGKKRYAYIAIREGAKIVQQYLGPVSDPQVKAKMRILKTGKKLPVKFYHLFWDVNPLKVDLKKNKRYVIERVLELGDLNALQWVQNIYPAKLIIETCETSRKISQRSKNLWRLWFGMEAIEIENER